MKRSQEDLLSLIQEVINEIEQNLTEPLSVKDFSAKSGYSIWQFQRIFRSMVGDTIGNYLRGRRLTMAASKILKTEEKIIDIALEYQFGSQEAFSRAFKTFFGETPKKVRDEKPNLIIKQKPKLSIENLRHFNGGIESEPQLIEALEQKFVGLEIDIPSHMEAALEIVPLLVSTWLEFNKRKSEIKNRLGKTSFGIAKSEGKYNTENMMRYLAVVEVSEYEDIPEGFSTYTIPKTTYAAFENKGLGNTTVHTITYIYGTWLPQSKFKRSAGDDMEIFDSRFDLNDENSVSKYLIPVQEV